MKVALADRTEFYEAAIGAGFATRPVVTNRERHEPIGRANMARHEAYRHLVARGFRTKIQGVAMHKNNDPGYCRPGVYIIDDWR